MNTIFLCDIRTNAKKTGTATSLLIAFNTKIRFVKEMCIVIKSKCV